VADAELVRIAETDRGEVMSVDLDHRAVAALVRAEDLGLVLAAVRELDRTLLGAVHDVPVREDRAVRRNDEAGSLRMHGPAAGLLRHALEKLRQWVVVVVRTAKTEALRCGRLDFTSGGDADDGGLVSSHDGTV